MQTTLAAPKPLRLKSGGLSRASKNQAAQNPTRLTKSSTPSTPLKPSTSSRAGVIAQAGSSHSDFNLNNTESIQKPKSFQMPEIFQHALYNLMTETLKCFEPTRQNDLKFYAVYHILDQEIKNKNKNYISLAEPQQYFEQMHKAIKSNTPVQNLTESIQQQNASQWLGQCGKGEKDVLNPAAATYFASYMNNMANIEAAKNTEDPENLQKNIRVFQEWLNGQTPPAKNRNSCSGADKNLTLWVHPMKALLKEKGVKIKEIKK